MIFWVAFITVALTALSDALPTPETKACPGVTPKAKNINITYNGTVEEGAAVLKKGTVAQLHIVFTADEDTSSLTAVVHGVIAGIRVPFPLDNPNACSNCNVSCPVQKETQYEYVASIDVKNSYPQMKLEVEWELQDDSKEDLLCYYISVKIV